MLLDGKTVNTMGDEVDYGVASWNGQIPGSRDERGLTRLTYARLDVDLPLGEEVLQVLHPQLHQVAP